MVEAEAAAASRSSPEQPAVKMAPPPAPPMATAEDRASTNGGTHCDDGKLSTSTAAAAAAAGSSSPDGAGDAEAKGNLASEAGEAVAATISAVVPDIVTGADATLTLMQGDCKTVISLAPGQKLSLSFVSGEPSALKAAHAKTGKSPRPSQEGGAKKVVDFGPQDTFIHVLCSALGRCLVPPSETDPVI